LDARRFEIVGVLGKGAQGLVVLARDHADASSEPVALKLVSRDAEPEAREQLRAEARVLAWLAHPNIVKVHRLLEKDGLPIVVMEHVDGASLEELIARGPLPIPVALEVTRQVAIALDAANNASGRDGQPLRVVHGDVRPENVLLARDGRVKVINFGPSADHPDAARADVPALAALLTAMVGEQLLPPEHAALVARMSAADGPQVAEVVVRLAEAAEEAADLAAFAAQNVPPIAKARAKAHFNSSSRADVMFLQSGLDIEELELGAPTRPLALRQLEAPEDIEPLLAAIARKPVWAVHRRRPSADLLVETLEKMRGTRDPRAVTRAHELTSHSDPRVVEAAWELLAAAC
jgi:serine/threonine protein kinase